MKTTTKDITTYRVTFQKLGRGDRAKDTTVDVEVLARATEEQTALRIERAVLRHARQYLGSKGVEVAVGMATKDVEIYVGGFRLVGRGTFTSVTPAVNA